MQNEQRKQWMRMFRMCVVWLGVWMIVFSIQTVSAQEAGCEEAGFYSILCGPYQVKKQRNPDQTREMTLISPTGAQVIYQAIPFAYFPDQRGSLKQVVEYYRQKLTQSKGNAPRETWYIHQGTRFYQMLFPPNVAMWMTSTKGGYLAIFATWTDPKDPLLQHIETARYAARRISETITPPTPAPQAAPTGQGAWFCNAQGTVQHCRKNRGAYYTPCSTRTAFGGGKGATRSAASYAAIRSCIIRRTQLYTLGNFPSGSSHYYNFSRQGARCVVTRCTHAR